MYSALWASVRSLESDSSADSRPLRLVVFHLQASPTAGASKGSRKDELRTQFHHVIDVAPTILEAAVETIGSEAESRFTGRIPKVTIAVEEASR